MSHRPSNSQNAHYVEGVHGFWIDEGYIVCRIECSDYYARQAQNFCGGCKEMDFLLYHPERRDLWLVEVKDYRFDARPKVGELVSALSRKVRDTMFLLRAASVAAPDEYPAEGISLKEFSLLAAEAETIHLAFLLEMGMGGMWPDGNVLANVKNMLIASMRFLDADLVCVPITCPRRVGPWRVVPAQGEVSKRVAVRRARKLEEIQEQRRLERLLQEEEKERRLREAAARVKEEKTERVPQWKMRLQRRLNGETANHEGRRKKRKQDGTWDGL